MGCRLPRDGVGTLGTATASGGGTWSFNYGATTTLPEGNHGFTVTATYGGVTSAHSAVFKVTVDLTGSADGQRGPEGARGARGGPE
jgi:hypothetical protein